ncbi:MAG: hypothetical protein WCJ45_06415 [bacterium]
MKPLFTTLGTGAWEYILWSLFLLGAMLLICTLPLFFQGFIAWEETMMYALPTHLGVVSVLGILGLLLLLAAFHPRLERYHLGLFLCSVFLLMQVLCIF